jgi:hypothetical protein
MAATILPEDLYTSSKTSWQPYEKKSPVSSEISRAVILILMRV